MLHRLRARLRVVYRRYRSVGKQDILTTLLIVRTALDILDHWPPGPVA